MTKRFLSGTMLCGLLWVLSAAVPAAQDMRPSEVAYKNIRVLTGVPANQVIQGMHVIKTALKRGKNPRVELRDPSQAQKYLDMGVQHFCIGWDVRILADWWDTKGADMRKMLRTKALTDSLDEAETILFALAKSDKSVRAEKLLPTGLRIVKEFTPGTNYLVHVEVWLENTRGEVIAVPPQEWVIGTATPVNPLDKGTLMKVSWLEGDKSSSVGETWFENATLGCIPGTKRTEQKLDGKFAWVAAQNQFFTKQGWK